MTKQCMVLLVVAIPATPAAAQINPGSGRDTGPVLSASLAEVSL